MSADQDSSYIEAALIRARFESDKSATGEQLRLGRLTLLSPHMPHFTPFEQEHIYLLYQLMKLQLDDQHGVSDAAADLRELRARHPELL